MICDSETTDLNLTIPTKTSEEQENSTVTNGLKDEMGKVLKSTGVNSDSIDEQTISSKNESTTQITCAPSVECIGNVLEIKNDTRTIETPTLPKNAKLNGFNRIPDLNELNPTLPEKPNKAYLKSNSAKEIIDVSSNNILNICIGTEGGDALRNELRNKFRQSVSVRAEQAPKDKPRSMVEVLSSSDSTHNSEITDFNKSIQMISSEINAIAADNASTVLEERISPSESRSLDSSSDPSFDSSDQNDQNDQNGCIKSSSLNVRSNCRNKNAIQPNPLAKSSAITFFCENLDELKRADSDSDGSFEEI